MLKTDTDSIILKTFLITIISANPVIVFLLSKSLSFTAIALLSTFLLLCTANLATNDCKWISIYVVNFVVLISIFVHFEVLFRYGFKEIAIPDMYSPRTKHFFNNGNLNLELNDEEYKSLYRTNKQGFRIGKNVSQDKTIEKCDWLFLGDSFTQGAQVDFEQIYTSILSKYFPDKIILNMGISGFGLPEEYYLFKNRGTSLSPSKVFLQLSAFNDFDNVRENESSLSSYLMHYSDLIRFIRFRKEYSRKEDLPLKRWVEPFRETESGNTNFNIFYKKDSPQKQKDKKKLTHYLKLLNTEVNNIGGELVVVLFPTKEQLYYSYFEEVIDRFEINPTLIDFSLADEFLKKICEENGITYLNLTKNLSIVSKQIFFSVDEHPNQFGHQQIAKTLADEIKNYQEIETKTKSLSTTFWAERYPSITSDGKNIIYQGLAGETYDIYLADSNMGSVEKVTSNYVDDTHPTIAIDKKTIVFSRGNQETHQTKVIRMSFGESEEKILTFSRDQYGSIPSLSPDGLFVTFTEWFFDSNTKSFTQPQIVITDLDGNNKRYVTKNNYENWRPVFSNDNKSIIFISSRDGNFDIFEYDLQFQQENQLTFTPFDEWDPQISSDNKFIVYSAYKDNNWDLFEMNRIENSISRLTFTKGDEWDPSYSPDGKNIIFAGEFGFIGGIYSFQKEL